MHPWHSDPLLAEKFHPECPDDIQVLIHDGGPRRARSAPELIWARITRAVGPGCYLAVALNQPHALRSVREGQTFKFLVSPEAEHPFLVSDRYMEEISAWQVMPCDRCGMDHLFDAPSELLPVIFPDLPEGATLASFTSFCPLCGGVQVLTARDALDEDEGEPAPARSSGKKPWWKFW